MIEATTLSATTFRFQLRTADPGKGTLILTESITNLNVTTAEYILIYVAAAIFTFLLAVGVVSVFIFCLVLVRGRKRFREFPFFAIVYHLTFANAVHISMLLTTFLPIILFESEDGSANLLSYKIGSYILMITDSASLYFTLLMTINRLAVFVFPAMLKMFTIKKIHFISFFIWIFVNLIVWWNYNYGTIRVFSRRRFNIQRVILGTNILTNIFSILTHFLPILMLIMYFIIWAIVVKKRNIVDDTQRDDRDRLLLIQAFAITLTLELMNITEAITPFFTKSSTTIQWLWTFFCYCISITNQIINPLLFLTMNRMVRNVARHIFSRNFSAFLSDNVSSHTPKPSTTTSKTIRAAFSFSCFGYKNSRENINNNVITF